MRVLCAGPWLGELGWEVMTWQGHLRAISHNYDRIIVCGPSGHKALYSDFASQYIEFDSPSTKANMWMNDANYEVTAQSFFRRRVEEAIDEFTRYDWLSPADVWKPYLDLPKWEQLIAIQPQEFIKFGNRYKNLQFEVVYHARKRDDWDSSFRNWEEWHCQEVLASIPRRMKNIVCIGTKTHALHIPGTIDMRDVEMPLLMDVLASCKVLVGPISGPIHLGALCGATQISWVTKQEHKDRLENKWNPFGAKTHVFCSDDSYWKERKPYHPEVKEVVNKIIEVVNV
ncbi:MAG: hypothetical protein WC998_07025 [Candidatus Paceibacterota bacterium]|jgi:hypothetical protein